MVLPPAATVVAVGSGIHVGSVVATAVGVHVGHGVFVGNGVGVAVGLGVLVGVGVDVGVAVAVGLGVFVGVAVALAVAVGVRVGLGVELGGLVAVAFVAVGALSVTTSATVVFTCPTSSSSTFDTGPAHLTMQNKTKNNTTYRVRVPVRISFAPFSQVSKT